MKPATATAMAACLEQLAAALREESQEQPKVTVQRVKLAVAAKESGIPASTLRELLLRREITATKLGRDWMVRLSDVEAFQAKHETRARGSLREAVAH